jgi:glycosyltransferase involved in cell wall biosynthesis
LPRSEHILVVTQQLGTVRTGVGTYANHLVSGLVSRGFRVSVATFPGSCGTLPGVEDYFPIERRRHDVTPGAWWSLARGVAHGLPLERFSLVHFTDAREALHYPGPATAVGMVHDAYALDCPRTPWALRPHHPDWLKRTVYYAVLRGLEPRAYRRLAFLMANAEDTRRKVIRGYQLNPKRIRSIRLGTDAPGPVEPEALDGSPAVLFVGSNFYRKGLPTLLRAAQFTLGNLPGLRVHVVGRDRNQGALEALAAGLGVADRLTFHGRVAQARLLAMMQGADVFCMPSRTEGYGLVFLEAMAVGTPVIGGAVGGTLELIRHEQNGLLVHPDDADGLAHQLLRLHRDARLRKRMVETGTKTASLHTAEGMVEETVAVYRKLRIPDPAAVRARESGSADAVAPAESAVPAASAESVEFPDHVVPADVVV